MLKWHCFNQQLDSNDVYLGWNFLLQCQDIISDFLLSSVQI